MIDEQMAVMRESLRARGRYRERLLREVGAHLEDLVADGLARGFDEAEAEDAAVRRLGDASAWAATVEPRSTRRVHALAGSVFPGVALGLFCVHQANRLHAHGARLGASLPYTAVWVIGLVAVALICLPVVATVVRHRGTIGTLGLMTCLSLVALGLLSVTFHLVSDGSLPLGRPDRWRLGAIAAGSLAAAGLLCLATRRRMLTRWPCVLGAGGVLVLAVHYAVPASRGPLAVLGLVACGSSLVGQAVVLLRERSLA